MKLFVLISGVVAVTVASPVDLPDTKAASPYENFGCQCDSLTFLDTYGIVQGNCKSSDETGARWCYLPVDDIVKGYSTCTDVGHGQTSSRFQGRQWSYEACATPAVYPAPPVYQSPPVYPSPPKGTTGCIGTKDGADCQEHPTDTKAASPFTNLGCQCDSLTFLDTYGQIQGNCKSTDETEARWCYLPVHGYSTCTDVGHGQTSSRFPGRQWSYEACATPPPPAGCIVTKDGAGCQNEYPSIETIETTPALPAGCIVTKDGAGCQNEYPSIETIINNNGLENNNNGLEGNNNEFENNNNGSENNNNNSENNNGFENNNNGFETVNNGINAFERGTSNKKFRISSREKSKINFNK